MKEILNAYMTRIVPAIIVVCIVSVGGLVYSLYTSLGELIVAEQKRVDIIQLAQELRSSSRELTSAARIFVTTGNPLSEKSYFTILDIRSGRLPRPSGMGVAAREAKSLLLLLKEKVTEEEFALLRESLAISDRLAQAEVEAINATKGLFRDESGNYTVHKAPDQVFATDLLFGDKYQQEISSILVPLDTFFHKMFHRMNGEVRSLQDSALIRLVSVGLVLACFFMSIIVSSYCSLVRNDMRSTGTLRSYIYIVLILLASISLPAWVTYSDARQDMMQAMEKRQTLLCREIYRELHLRLDHSMELASIVASRPPIIRFMREYAEGNFKQKDLQMAEEILHTFSGNYADSARILLVDDYGIPVLSSLKNVGSRTYSSILSATALEDVRRGNAVVGTLARNSISAPIIAVPVRMETGMGGESVYGAVVLVMELGGEASLWDGRLADEENMNIFVLDSAATVVLSSNPAWAPGTPARNNPAGQLVLDGKEGLQAYVDGDGVKRLGVYMKLPELAWTVAVSSSQDVIFGSIRRLLTRSLILSSVAILVAIVLVTLLLSRLVQSLRRGEERLEMAIQGAGIGIWDLNVPTGEFLYNELWAQVNGLPPQRGERTLDWVLQRCHVNDLPYFQDMLYDLSRVQQHKGVHGNCECRSLHEDGNWYWQHITARVTLCDPRGRSLRISGTTVDIHARRLAQMTEAEQRQHLEEIVSQRTHELEIAKNQALAATEAKSTFLSTVSHELRTPMNAIIGFIHLFDRSNLYDRQQSYLEKMNIAANALLLVINDVLDISKIEAHKMETEYIPFLLHPLLDGVHNIIGSAAREKGLQFEMHIDEDVPNAVKGDPTRLQQILLNLLGNAVKFTQDGQLGLFIHVERGMVTVPCPADKILLHFTVTDTGIGMTDEHMTRLFQPFSQADNSVTRKFGGTGLGLAISKQLAELMGGQISVESAFNVGTSFHVLLPVGIADATKLSAAENTNHISMLQDVPAGLPPDSSVALRTGSIPTVSHEPHGPHGFHEENAGSASHSNASAGAFDAVKADSGQADSPENRPAMAATAATAATSATAGTPATAGTAATAATAGTPATAGTAGTAATSATLAMAGTPAMAVTSATAATSATAGTAGTPATPVTPAPPLTPAVRSALRGAGLPLKALVVDDNEVNLEIACAVLEAEGLVVDVAHDGLEGVEKVRDTLFDVVFMDMQMPIMDGLESTRRIRELAMDPDFVYLQNLPIIAMTANSMAEDKKRCLEAGMNDHLAKPIDPVRLHELLEYWVGLNSTTAE